MNWYLREGEIDLSFLDTPLFQVSSIYVESNTMSTDADLSDDSDHLSGYSESLNEQCRMKCKCRKLALNWRQFEDDSELDIQLGSLELIDDKQTGKWKRVFRFMPPFISALHLNLTTIGEELRFKVMKIIDLIH
jgi:hypothetical protein